MIWFILALLGALSQATYHTLVKKMLSSINQYVLAAGGFLSAFFLTSLLLIVNGFPEIKPLFYLAVFATTFLNVIATILYYRALKISDLSLIAPMLSLTPIFIVFISFVLLGEKPTYMGILGILLIVIGVYVINSGRHVKYFLEPFKNIYKNKGIFYALLVAFMYSLSAIFDKLMVVNSDPIFSVSVYYLLIGIIFSVILFFKNRRIKIQTNYKNNFYKFFIIGAILALEVIVINTALTMQIVPYVMSIKRLSIIFSIFYGFLIFKESNILKRSLGALVMIIGAVIIIFS